MEARLAGDGRASLASMTPAVGPVRPTWRIMLSAVGWLFVSGLVVPVIWELLERWLGQFPAPAWMNSSDARAIGLFVDELVPQLASIVIALRLARRAGGNVAVGLGNYKIQRRALLVALAGGLLACLVAPIAAEFLLPDIAEAHPIHSPLLIDSALEARPVPIIATTLIVTILGPLSEELFFRGWLWTELRRSRGPVATAILSAAPWILLHWPQGLLKPLFVLPSAVLFSLARHYCGSVRASIALHIVNNGTAIAVMIAIGLLLRFTNLSPD